LVRLARVITWPAAAIATIAVLQTLQFPPVLSLLLGTYWPITTAPSEVLSRGTTTLASPIATGDYVLLAAALLIALGVRGLVSRREVLIVGAVLAAGAFA